MRLHRSSLLIAAVVVATCTLSACKPAPQGDARADIEKVNQAFAAAVDQGDAAAIAKLYTRDGAALPPGGETVTGQPALEEMWKGALASGIKGLRLTTTETETHGDSAIEIGNFEALAPDGSSAQRGKYVVIWKREDGAWKLHRDIWNSSTPPAAPSPPAAEEAPAPPAAQ